MTGPTADDLTDGQVAAIVAASDTAHVVLAELHERDPSVRAAREHVDELTAATEPVIAAYVAAGLDRERAGQAVTVWLIERRPDGGRVDPRTCIRHADEQRWREPGDPAGGLGQR